MRKNLFINSAINFLSWELLPYQIYYIKKINLNTFALNSKNQPKNFLVNINNFLFKNYISHLNKNKYNLIHNDLNILKYPHWLLNKPYLFFKTSNFSNLYVYVYFTIFLKYISFIPNILNVPLKHLYFQVLNKNSIF